MKYCYELKTNDIFVILEETKNDYVMENENYKRYVIRKSMFDKWFRMR